MPFSHSAASHECHSFSDMATEVIYWCVIQKLVACVFRV